MFSPVYAESWALVVGIDKYVHANPLRHARHDAEAVAAALRDRFGFPEDHISCLYDEQATCQAIRHHFLALTGDHVANDDRVFVFFAGHGQTRAGRRGQTGFLVPVDGHPDDWSTLIRWDELTRNAEHIAAKHVLFVMDACYGGLAVTRGGRPGSTRFLKDMLSRYSRQVITGGKADELVADAGGPRDGHSVFTGHFLDALEGAAASAEGVITANGVMAYVYDRVANDHFSRQTPHFGYIDGDGDFVFTVPESLAANDGADDAKEATDVLVHVPAQLATPSDDDGLGVIEKAKDYLSDPRHRIRLDDLVNEQLRRTLALLEPTRFNLNAPISVSEVEGRLTQYEEALGELPGLMILLGRWGQSEQAAQIARILGRVADLSQPAGGITGWLGLRWMPVNSLMYYGGIAALSVDNYPMLAAMYDARSNDRSGSNVPSLAFARAVRGMSEGSIDDLFKLLPNYGNLLVPRSEYLFRRVQPLLDDLLFLGTSYEALFDRFEVLHALCYANAMVPQTSTWGPLGRFAYKVHRDFDGGPLTRIEKEAEEAGDAWPPLRVGLFGRSADKYLTLSKSLRSNVSGLGWM